MSECEGAMRQIDRDLGNPRVQDSEAIKNSIFDSVPGPSINPATQWTSFRRENLKIILQVAACWDKNRGLFQEYHSWKYEESFTIGGLVSLSEEIFIAPFLPGSEKFTTSDKFAGKMVR